MEQQLQKELAYIKNRLKTYFDEMLVEDIKKMMKKGKEDEHFRFTIPYILLISAGIDFLGGLEKGFPKSNEKGNSRLRSCHFIKEWMGKVNELYKFEGMGKVIYNSARNGASHQAIFKEGVESYKDDDFREKHLYVRINKGKERIFIHALQYADDFIKAQKIFREEFLVEKNIHAVYERLRELKLKEKEMSEIFDLIKILKQREKSCVFQEELSISPSASPDESEE